jgi:hypothetical protein
MTTLPKSSESPKSSEPVKYDGRSSHPLYPVWVAIKQRCHNPGSQNYHHYGARGISLCPEWRNDSRAFIDWIESNLGPKPPVPESWTSARPYWSIDRLDVNGDYEPGNIRPEWADPFVQAANTRHQLNPMNGISQASAGTFGYHVQRDGTSYARGGFPTAEDAMSDRDAMLTVLDQAGPEAAGAYLLAAAEDDARAKEEAARIARDAAREARKALDELDRQARREARWALAADRAERWHELNASGMSLAEVATTEGVSTALVSIELGKHGIPVVLHNASGAPGLKATKSGKYEVRATINGRRVHLGTVATPDDARSLIETAQAQTLAA